MQNFKEYLEEINEAKEKLDVKNIKDVKLKHPNIYFQINDESYFIQLISDKDIFKSVHMKDDSDGKPIFEFVRIEVSNMEEVKDALIEFYETGKGSKLKRKPDFS